MDEPLQLSSLTQGEVRDVAYLVDEHRKKARNQLRPDNAVAVAEMKTLIESLLARRYAHIESMEWATRRMFADYRRIIHLIK